MAKTSSTTRVQMELPNTSLDRLKYLKDKTESASYAEVTKNSYKLYSKIIDLVDSGNSLLIKDKDGNIREVEFFI